MTAIRLVPLNFAGPCGLKAFGGASFCFHLRHDEFSLHLWTALPSVIMMKNLRDKHGSEIIDKN